MALFQSSIVRNRLLSTLTEDDFALLEPKLKRVPLSLRLVLVEPNQPIQHVYVLESGIVSSVADTEEGRIEVGIIGREGMAGAPVVLGADRTPHILTVQGVGEAFKIGTEDLRAAIRARPSIFRPLGRFVHALMVQMGQTIYSNVAFNVEARLARWILMTQDRVGGSDLVLTHGFLAAMLGVRRPGVTTATHVLEGIGAIRNTRGRIEVRDREKLLSLAGDSYRAAEDEYEQVMVPA